MRRKRSFDEWMLEVSLLMNEKFGFHPLDLPDFNYRQAYEEGKSPNRAMRSAVAAARRGY